LMMGVFDKFPINPMFMFRTGFLAAAVFAHQSTSISSTLNSRPLQTLTLNDWQ
jgi:hypothetical protein